jgi:type IV pilus assembly protein PilM
MSPFGHPKSFASLEAASRHSKSSASAQRISQRISEQRFYHGQAAGETRRQSSEVRYMAGGSYVGLDIGSNQIKVAELRKSGTGVEVVALGVGPTPPEAFDNNLIVDAHLLGQAVKNLLKQSGIRTVDCVSSVGGQSAVVVRVIDLPQMSAAELAETMKYEVERQVPFAANEVIMDYQTIDRPEGYAEGQNMDVLLAVAQQDMVDRHVEMLFAAGLKPKAIDVEPLAAGRTLLDLGPQLSQPGHTVAIVNIGASNTDVGVFRDKLLTFPRTLPLGGDALTRAIADAMQIDHPTAEQYKLDVGEVILGQSASPQQYGAPDAGFGGFYDFGVPGGEPAPQPEAAPSPFFQPGGVMFGGGPEPANTPPPVNDPSAPSTSPSGRMPFDFATPGAEEQPVASPTFGQPEYVTPAPFETPGQPAPDPFAAPTQPAPDPNLPMPASGAATDPYRDQLRINVFNSMAPVLAEIAQELRRSLDYYRGRSQDAQIHEILLVGGTARLRNLASFLEQELGIPTRVADPLLNVQVTSKNYSREHLEEVASLFPISIGLGARELIFVPTAAKKKKK